MAKILVVDDDSDTVRTTIDALTDHGYEARGATRWQEIPRALHEWLPEVIVLDLLMPGVSGVEWLNMLRANTLYRRIKVIVVSGAAPKLVQTWALSNGATAFLPKPVELELLLETIERVVRG